MTTTHERAAEAKKQDLDALFKGRWDDDKITLKTTYQSGERTITHTLEFNRFSSHLDEGIVESGAVLIQNAVCRPTSETKR